jgi:protein SCO1/2
MKKRNTTKAVASVCLLLGLGGCASPENQTSDPIQRALPYFGNHDIAIIPSADGSSEADTLYYTIPAFAFTNQYNLEVSDADYAGRIYVADYFFTTCPTICPVMSSQLSRLQAQLIENNLLGEVKLLSHTVDPENDTPDVLRVYAERLKADSANWNFVTGTPDDLYYQAKSGYYLTALPSDTAAGGFFHSDTFVLIDRKGHIRGYYDGTSTQEVDQLFIDIQTLISASQ